ncbi:MAG: hypothetical protein H6502_02735 [Candidatus Woesearchaeota archaeon]|nr:MAG: hypothetical protein H6502_02735 [Candidatus Woesearchaeota archaeon]
MSKQSIDEIKRMAELEEFSFYMDYAGRAFDAAKTLIQEGDLEGLERYCEDVAKEMERLPESCNLLKYEYSALFWILAGKEDEAKRVLEPCFEYRSPHTMYPHRVSIEHKMWNMYADLAKRGFLEPHVPSSFVELYKKINETRQS